MDNELNRPASQDDSQINAEPQSQLEWIEPSFERMTLKEAMAGQPNPMTFDGIFFYS